MFDSGVRSAADAFKALALGAKYVFIGRLWIWGLSIAGEHGEYHQQTKYVTRMYTNTRLFKAFDMFSRACWQNSIF